jgi:hypothetical protein
MRRSGNILNYGASLRVRPENSARIITRPDDRGVRVHFSNPEDIVLLHDTKTAYENHQASQSMGTGDTDPMIGRCSMKLLSRTSMCKARSSSLGGNKLVPSRTFCPRAVARGLAEEE